MLKRLHSSPLLPMTLWLSRKRNRLSLSRQNPNPSGRKSYVKRDRRLRNVAKRKNKPGHDVLPISSVVVVRIVTKKIMMNSLIKDLIVALQAPELVA